MNPGSYERLLHQAGFVIDRIELIPKDMVHDGEKGLQGWIRTTWLPYTQRVPATKRKEFIATIAAKYMEKEPADSQGRVHVAMVRLEVAANKPA